MQFSRLQSQVLSGTDSIYIPERKYLLTLKCGISTAELQFCALKHMAHVPLTPPGTAPQPLSQLACHTGQAGFPDLGQTGSAPWPAFWYMQEDILSQQPFTPLELSLTLSRADQPLRLGFVWVNLHGTAQAFCQQVGWTDLLGMNVHGCTLLPELG